MTTDPLFRSDPYLREAEAHVVMHAGDGGISLERSIFYPTGGGQPGDTGRIIWHEGEMEVVATIKGAAGSILLMPQPGTDLPPVGTRVVQVLDWDRRYRHMRVHTALHLLSVVVPLPVTGGQIGSDRGRLDFDMPSPPEEPAALQAALNGLVERDLFVTDDWITDEELTANPGLVKTMSVAPPLGHGKVRLVRIADQSGLVDLQPCGGTHVGRTSEIGPLTIGKIENKGRQNRRIHVLLRN